MPESVTVRPAAPGDVEALLRVKARSWREAYGALLPSAYLDAIEDRIPEDVPAWTALIGSDRDLWVADDDGRLLGVALAGTAVSVHYKFQADRRFADYERTGDPLLRPDIEALDDRAAVAFGVGMTGLALFTWRLAIR